MYQQALSFTFLSGLELVISKYILRNESQIFESHL